MNFGARASRADRGSGATFVVAQTRTGSILADSMRDSSLDRFPQLLLFNSILFPGKDTAEFRQLSILDDVNRRNLI